MSKPETIERCIYLISGSYVVKKRGKWSKPFKTIADARDERDKIEIEQAPKPAGGALARFYYDVYVPNYLINMKQNSQDTMGAAFTKKILPYFEKKRIGEIKKLDCMNFRAELQKKGTLNNVTINGIMVLLSLLFSKAEELEIISKNPCKKMGKLKEAVIDRPTLTVDEVVELVNSIQHPYAYAIALAGLSGARESEVMGFQWGDFTLSDNGQSEISFNRSMNRKCKIDTLKSDYQRVTLPMTKTLAKLLIQYREKRLDDLWLFQGEVKKYCAKIRCDGYKYHRKPVPPKYEYNDPRYLYSWWAKNIREKYDFVDDNMRFHDLKHTFATNVVASCPNIKMVQQLCRHAQIETTLAIYAHVRPEELTAQVASWDW